MPPQELLKNWLELELRNVASQLDLVTFSLEDLVPNQELLYGTITYLNELSFYSDDASKKKILTIIAILWTYKKQEWDVLKDFLIVILSRIGYAPSASMVDENYDKQTNTYSPFGSLFNAICTSLHQRRYEVEVHGKKFLLTEFQQQVWNKIDHHRLLGISAPTSAGKSFIVLLKAIDLLSKRNGSIIYVVPTLSLISQVAADFHFMLKTFGMNDYEVATTYQYTNSEKKVFILTQERAIAAFEQDENEFPHIRLLIVDEIQNIEKVSNDNEHRSKILFDLLTDFRFSVTIDHILIAGPRITNIGNVAHIIFGGEAEEVQSTMSPVANFTYSIVKENRHFYLKQRSEIYEYPVGIQIRNSSAITEFSKKAYTDNYHQQLAIFVQHLGHDSKNIIFAPTSTQANKTAIALSNYIPLKENINEDGMIDYIRSSVHPNYSLCDTLSHDIAYHHGKLPQHVRKVIEYAIRNKRINNVVCTTTLMQGVNLPAQNIIIRKPNLFTQQNNQGINPKLSGYDLANLRGRAGRLLKDLIGRAFVLDEDSFVIDSIDETASVELLEDDLKTLSPGYEEAFLEYKDSILHDLETGENNSSKDNDYFFLLAYIRQAILRYGGAVYSRLRTVGINITPEEVSNIESQLSQLQVPRSICFKNRYWDPFDLERLYKISSSLYLPGTVHERDLVPILLHLLTTLQQNFLYYYKKHLDVDDRILHPLCITASSWANEKSLSIILSNQYYNSPKRIDDGIALITQKISYGIPILLKPLYDMKLPDSIFLTCIEMGAFRPAIRKMIEWNIPREVAIRLADIMHCRINDEINDSALLNNIRTVASYLSFWERVQLDSIL